MELILIKIVIYALPMILAITVHEAAHGYAAKYFGDLTAEKAGRITLNPLKHIDPIGTIVLPAVTVMLGGFLFGWAKPVPVNFANLRNPKKDMLWVAAAGPASNLVMAMIWAVILSQVNTAPDGAAYLLVAMSGVGVWFNLILMVLNLLPLPPLDGGRIAVSLLPMDLAVKLSKVEPYGFPILIALMFMGVFSQVIVPIVESLEQIILRIFT